ITRGFLAFTRPAFLFTCSSRMEREPLGLQPELRTPPAEPTTHVRPRTDPRALARSCTFDFNYQSTSNGQLTHSCDLASQPVPGLLRGLRHAPRPSAGIGPCRAATSSPARAGRFPRSP